MVTKLVPHGDGYALVIEKPILDLLHLAADTPLDVSTDGKVFIASTSGDDERRKELHTALERANSKYGPALRRLAAT